MSQRSSTFAGGRDGQGGQGGDDSVELGGHRQELRRTLGSFQVFAISFVFISVAVGIFGIFGTFDEVLRSSGPVGIWLWPVAALGQTLVALVVARFAARIPLSGSSCQWASRLSSTRVGRWSGRLTFCYPAIAVVAIDDAPAGQAFMPLLDMKPDEDVARMITLVVLLVQALPAIASTRLVSWIDSAAVGLEPALVVVVAIALVVVAATDDGDAADLASRGVTENAPDHFAIGGGLMIAMIMGLATLVGFGSAANLAEETRDPHRSVPRAIVGSVAAAGLLGMLFLITLTVAIEDVSAVTADGSPVAAIMRQQLGSVAESVLLVLITFAFFGAGIVVMVSCSRLVHAMARDGRFPAHRVMRRVDPRTRTPVPATVLILAPGVALMVVLPGEALLELITASTILPALIHGSTIVLCIAVRGRLSRQEGAFDLGRLELPVAVCALTWTLVALFVLVSPPEALTSVVVVAGLLVLGGVFFAGMLMFDRQAPENEPGDVEAFRKQVRTPPPGRSGVSRTPRRTAGPGRPRSGSRTPGTCPVRVPPARPRSGPGPPRARPPQRAAAPPRLPPRRSPRPRRARAVRPAGPPAVPGSSSTARPARRRVRPRSRERAGRPPDRSPPPAPGRPPRRRRSCRMSASWACGQSDRGHRPAVSR
ncbi:APC family permease [Streptomyces sp. NPDC093094]|uniref:APC family permease n=1 Tax=Streptomyces sp. NPDC093094 TaxID=3366026 RepID=UPI0037F7ED46